MKEARLTAARVLIAEALAVLVPPVGAVAMLERAPATWLSEEAQGESIQVLMFAPGMDVEDWERGRVFCAEFELRWDEEGLVYTGVPSPELEALGFQETVALEGCAGPLESHCLLWGARREGNLFVDGRIPRRLRYPVPSGVPGDRATVRVKEWFDSEGELAAWRAVALETAK